MIGVIILVLIAALISQGNEAVFGIIFLSGLYILDQIYAP